MTRALLCCAVALGLAAPSAALEAARAPAVAVWVRSEIPFVVAVVNPALPPAAAVARAEPAPAGVLVDVDPLDPALVRVRGAPEVQALVLRVAAGIAGPGGAVFAEGSVAGAGGATAPGRPMPVPLPDPPPAASDVPTLCATQPLPRDPELLGLGGDVLTRLVASALAPMSAVVTLEADAAGLRLIACAPQPMSLAQVAAAMGTLDARGNRSALVAAARGGTARRRASAGGWASAAARAYLATGQVLRARDDSDDATLLARARARVLPWAWRAARSPRPG